MAESLHICFYGPFTHLPFCCCAMYFDLKVHPFASIFCSSDTQSLCRTPLPRAVVSERLALGGHCFLASLVFAVQNQTQHSETQQHIYVHTHNGSMYTVQTAYTHTRKAKISLNMFDPQLSSSHI